jgi:lysozyme family protein
MPLSEAEDIYANGKTVNGVFSDSLKDAINACDASWFIKGMKDERLTFMHNIKGGSMWQTFGRGWLARVNDLTVYSLNLALEKPLGPAKGSDLPDIPLVQDPSWLRVDIVDNPKGKAEDTPDTNEEIAVGGGTAVTGGIAGLAGAHDFGYYAIILTIVILLGGAGYILYQRYKSKKTNETVILPDTVIPLPST